MSYGPVVPSIDELFHQLVSVAIHRGGWIYIDGTVGGVSFTPWPEPEAAPPAGMAPGDVVALRPLAAHEAGAKDVIYFTHAADVDVGIARVSGGYSDAWDVALHAPVVGAATLPLTNLNNQLVGTYGDLFVVDDHGLAYVQIDSAGTFGERRYWGYLNSAARNPDGTGAALGELPAPFPLGSAELDPTVTASTFSELTHFVEYDAIVTSHFPAPTGPMEATRAGASQPTVQLLDMSVITLSGGATDQVVGTVPGLWRPTLTGPPETTLTQVRDPESGDRYLACGDDALVAFGPLAPDGGVFYRILTHGGPVVP